MFHCIIIANKTSTTLYAYKNVIYFNKKMGQNVNFSSPDITSGQYCI